MTRPAAAAPRGRIAPRHVVALGLGAAMALALALALSVWLAGSEADREPSEPAGAARAAPADGGPVRPRSVDAPPAPAAQAVVAATPDAEGAAPVDPGPRTSVPVRLGSEGYAAWVEQVLQRGHASEAAEAVQVMNACLRSVDVEGAVRAWTSVAHASGSDFRADLLRSVQRHQQRCQTLTPAHYAQRLTLAQRAVDAQWPGAPALLQDLKAPAQRDPEQELNLALDEAFMRLQAERAQR